MKPMESSSRPAEVVMVVFPVEDHQVSVVDDIIFDATAVNQWAEWDSTRRITYIDRVPSRSSAIPMLRCFVVALVLHALGVTSRRTCSLLLPTDRLRQKCSYRPRIYVSDKETLLENPLDWIVRDRGLTRHQSVHGDVVPSFSQLAQKYQYFI